VATRKLSSFLKSVLAVAVAAGALAVPFLHNTPPAAAAAGPLGSTGGANLLFSDEFNTQTLDSTKWQTCAWWSSTTCSIETNNELELYTKNNVSVGNGALKLEARHENAVGWNGKTYNYTSGMISTGGRSGQTAPGFTFTYGYMEARVKVPKGQGLWPAFWTLPADYSWPPEIDAMEILGQAPNVQHMTYHYTDASGSSAGPGASWTGPDFSAGWHTFGVDWEPNALTWYVDGVARWTFTDTAAITNKPSYLIFDLAVGGDWPGSPNAATSFPSSFAVDYVRVWDRFSTASPPAPSAYSAAVTADAPVGYWRLGESSGSVAADSAGNNTGTYVAGVGLSAASLVPADAASTAASFDGLNDVVTVASTAALSPKTAVTVETWVRPKTIPAAGVFTSLVTKAESYSLQFNGSQLEFTTMQNGTRRRVQAPAGKLVAGQSYYVVGTYDGTTQRLYINGVQVAAAAFSSPLTVNTNRVLLGSWDSKSEFFAGSLDEVAVYGGVLTPAQITNHYTKATATP
jgi:beta-glucanase (GH16 family)